MWNNSGKGDNTRLSWGQEDLVWVASLEELRALGVCWMIRYVHIDVRQFWQSWQYKTVLRLRGSCVSGLTRGAKGSGCLLDGVWATRSSDQGFGRPGGQFVQLSSDLWLRSFNYSAAGQILGGPGVLDLRIETSSALLRPPSSIWKHSLRTIQPEILIQIYWVLIYLD